MSKKIIGLQSRHDGGYAVLNNGEITEHVEIERYTRIKEDGGNSWEYFVDRYLKPRSISIDYALENFDFVSPMPENTITHHANNVYSVPDVLKPSYYGHHLCHASHAYYSSPYDDSIVISIDNAGMETHEEVISCGIYLAKGKEIKRVWDISSDKFSLGSLWGRMTRWVFKLWSGYPRGHQAGSVMAMAAMGDPNKYYTELHDMMGPTHKQAVASPPGALRGVYVPPEEEVIHPFLDKYRKIAEEDEQEKFNLAASLQQVTEECLLDIVGRAITLARGEGFGTFNICFSGGCALNSVAMGRIWKYLAPQGWKVYIPPVPYDGGLNIGAAQYHYHNVLGNPKYYGANKDASSYLGEQWPKEDIDKVLEEAKNIQIDLNVDLDRVAQHLADGKIISVYNGKSESGRRALGNRSILANPAIPNMKQIINDRVKHRQWYRPFAPSILEEHGDKWFEAFFPSPYMSFVFNVREEMKGKAPAIEHFDGTARIQTVNREQNDWYYDLISKFYEITGIPLVLNTSFNDQEPIVETPQDAMNCFLGTDIDYLYFAETKDLVSKND